LLRRAASEASLQTGENTVCHGHARFIGPRDLAIGSVQRTAEQIFINVGGRAAAAIPGIQ
jgi:hypothetical protein